MTGLLQVALPVPLEQSFDYLCDEASLPAPGCRVLVPFGSRRMVGIVLGAASGVAPAERKLREIERVLDPEPLFHGELFASLRWAARYYQHPLGEVLSAALPAALRSARALPPSGRPGYVLSASGRAALAATPAPRGARLRELLQTLAGGPLGTSQLTVGASTLRTALGKGWVEHARVAPAAGPAEEGPPLNDEQRAAAAAVLAERGRFAPFLLDGVTGSGKTEVYLDIIRACLADGRQALVLVPEIALTPQTLRRFRTRLGVEIGALHSGLGEVERAATWLAAGRGELPVVVGTRSAILVPLARPGVLIVDEEHDSSYKQQDGWRYHARDLALVRARALVVPVVLGSATPSLESLANVQAGRYRHLRLRRRAGSARPPALDVVDLRHQRLEHGLSQPAREAIAASLARGEQVLVFRNRRGYAPVLLCRDCGWNARCADCERPLTLHQRAGRLRCHHCGRESRQPTACLDCGGANLLPLGAGTERIETALAEAFPRVPILRIDRDTTRGRRQREALLDALPAAGARILVGTQMLAKGHDLPQLTLVVVVGVDEGLYSVDFRAGERLAQLVVQVAGRAGRADQPGKVLLQTHDPAHPLLQTLLQRGYHALADQLLEERRRAALPPFAQLALLRAEDPSHEALHAFLTAAVQLAGDPAVSARGPLDAPLPRRGGAHRGQLLLESASRPALQAFLPGWLEAVRALPAARRLRWSIDVDPVDLY